MTPSKSKHPLHETSTKPVATGGIPMVEKLREEGLGYGIGPAIVCQEAADLIEQLVEALELWEAYDNQDEADFAQAGPMLLYARAIDATRTALSAARGESGK